MDPIGANDDFRRGKPPRSIQENPFPGNDRQTRGVTPDSNSTPLPASSGSSKGEITKPALVPFSERPVLIDHVSVDLVNEQSGNEKARLNANPGTQNNTFRALYPQTDWEVQLKYAEKIGIL
jgi:hypothetical protein